MTNEDYDDFYAYSEVADIDWLPRPKVKVYRRITQEFTKKYANYMELCGQNVNTRDMNSFFYKCPRTAMKRLTNRIHNKGQTMSYKISKELFEAVMSLDIEKIEATNIKINYSKVGQCQEDDDIKFLLMSFTISINDFFFFKCKEYAFCNGYELMSGLYSNDNNARGKCIVYRCEDDKERVIKIFNEDDELQALFDACQWILENKDKQ